MGKTFINSQGTIVYMYLVVLHWCSNWTLTENQPGIAVFPALIIKGWLKTVWGWKYQWFGLFDRNLPQQVNERFPLGIRLLHHGWTTWYLYAMKTNFFPTILSLWKSVNWDYIFAQKLVIEKYFFRMTFKKFLEMIFEQKSISSWPCPQKSPTEVTLISMTNCCRSAMDGSCFPATNAWNGQRLSGVPMLNCGACWGSAYGPLQRLQVCSQRQGRRNNKFEGQPLIELG